MTTFDLIRSYCDCLRSLFAREGLRFDRITDLESIELFEKSILLSEQVIRKYGLPVTPVYLDMLPWEEVFLFGEYEIHQLMARMEEERRTFLQEMVKPDLIYLEEAGAAGYQASDVLLDMGLRTHIYLEFVYQQLFLKGYAKAEDVLREWRNIGHDVQGLKDVALAGWSLGEARNRILSRLKKFELMYVEEFLSFSDALQNENLQAAIVPVYENEREIIWMERLEFEEGMGQILNDTQIIRTREDKGIIYAPESLRVLLSDVNAGWKQIPTTAMDKHYFRLINNFSKNDIFDHLLLGFFPEETPKVVQPVEINRPGMAA